MKEGVMRTILFGLLLWVVPFIVAVLVWDPVTNAPIISIELFSGLMATVWAITFAVVACMYSKGTTWDCHQGWKIGITWYLTVIVLEFIVLGIMFAEGIGGLWHLLLTDSPNLIIPIAIGYVVTNTKGRKKQ